MGIGIKLSSLLRERGSNPNELAQKINVPVQTIYSIIKRDSKKADIDVLIKISKELGVEPEYFCDIELEKAEDPYRNVERLIARNGNELSSEQKLRLIKLLSEIKSRE